MKHILVTLLAGALFITTAYTQEAQYPTNQLEKMTQELQEKTAPLEQKQRELAQAIVDIEINLKQDVNNLRQKYATLDAIEQKDEIIKINQSIEELINQANSQLEAINRQQSQNVAAIHEIKKPLLKKINILKLRYMR
jgi:biotin-(acetyl-CoA carboxylase) ligase